MFYKDLYLKELSRIIGSMEENKWKYIIATLLSCLNYAVGRILAGFLNKDLINSVVENDRGLLFRAFIIGIIVVFISCIFFPIVMYISGKNIKLFMLKLRNRTAAHIAKLPVSKIYGSLKGDLMSRLTIDLKAIESALGEQLWSFLRDVFYGTGAFLIMFWLDWKLSNVVIVLGVISTFFNTRYSKTIKTLSDQIQLKLGILTQHSIDAVEGARTQRIYGLNETIFGQFAAHNGGIAELQIERNIKNAKIESINFILSTFNVLGVLGIGIYMFLSKQTDLGTVIAIITLQGAVTTMFLQAGVFLSQLQSSLAGAKRVFEFMDEAEEVDIPLPAHDHRPSLDDNHPGDMIVFQKVSFSYNVQNQFLDGIDISIPKGKMTALVGASGSGKTTIIRLILKLFDRQEGSIFIQGRDIDIYSLDDLRSMISYVPQDSFLFDDTIEGNIRLGKPDATRDEIVAAAKAAYIDDFISELRDGYDTRVGEKGILLSGGQKQRIAIARSILRDSPILLLDEATSALDSESEFLVQKAINNIVQNKTVLVIAHRLSTIENADIIYVLDNGKVVEKGSHHELIQQKEIYYKMYTSNYNTAGNINDIAFAKS